MKSKSNLFWKEIGKRNSVNVRGQVTIFIIIAIVLVAAIAGYFLLRDRISTGLPASFKPIEQSYLDCISEKAESGKIILASQGGYIEMPEFEAGSDFAPFSSQLDFNGIGVQYWNYISGNGIWKERVPSKTVMEQELADFIKQESAKCSFEEFVQQGYVVSLESPTDAKVAIGDNSVDVEVSSVLAIQKEQESARQTAHKITLNSKLGKMHQEALDIYNNQKQTLFLENYGIDVLRLYAPVDGAEVSCAPKIWIPQQVTRDLKAALEANIGAIRTKGNYYKISDEKKYFVQDIATDDSVNFIYSASFPGRIEIWPVENNVMRADPIGNQEGLGILGFCYVPYHFVYDLYFPVLIQVYDNTESFQFASAVVIDKNKPRQGLVGEVYEGKVDVCKYLNSEVRVSTYDSRLNPVEAEIGFKCFDAECNIGKTASDGNEASLTAGFPQCVNGFIIANAEGYAEKKQIISTNEESMADVILDKLYDVSINLELDGKEVESAIVYFNSPEYSTTLVWPEQKQIKLIQGGYNITMQAFRNSSITIPASSTKKCVDVPKPGLLGAFGQKQEQCFDINMPAQTLSGTLVGGGRNSDFFTEDRLERGNFKINGAMLEVPTSLEQVQKNYELFETKKIYITDE